MRRLNLVPTQARKGRPVAARTFLSSLSFKVILVFFIFLAIGILSQFLSTKQHKWQLSKAKTQLQAAKLQLSRLQTEQLSLAKERQDILKKRVLVDAGLEYLKSSRMDKPKELSEALVYFPTLMPDEIWINKLSVDREEMVIEGSTLNNQAISNLMESLNRSKKFRESSFSFTKKSTIGDITLYNFEVVTHLVH